MSFKVSIAKVLELALSSHRVVLIDVFVDRAETVRILCPRKSLFKLISIDICYGHLARRLIQTIIQRKDRLVLEAFERLILPDASYSRL